MLKKVLKEVLKRVNLTQKSAQKSKFNSEKYSKKYSKKCSKRKCSKKIGLLKKVVIFFARKVFFLTQPGRFIEEGTKIFRQQAVFRSDELVAFHSYS